MDPSKPPGAERYVLLGKKALKSDAIEFDFPSFVCYIFFKRGILHITSKLKISPPKDFIGLPPKKQTQGFAEMKKSPKIITLFILSALFFSSFCSSKPKTSILLRDPVSPPKIVREVFTKEGKSDYFLLNDEGYSFRLIYLCENRVLNFTEEPKGNPVLVSIQPILNTAVESQLSADDRRRIWVCMERKVKEQQFQIDELRRRIVAERVRLEKEVASIQRERNQFITELQRRKKLEAEKKRQIEQERRRTEAERLRKIEEEQRRRIEEERKLRFYLAGRKEESSRAADAVKATESGVFLALREIRVHAQPMADSKVIAIINKYDIYDVVNSKIDSTWTQWHQILLSEHTISEKGKRYGWTPEEKSFWSRHKLRVWVYPGDITKIDFTKPLKLYIDDVQFTGKRAAVPDRSVLYEVTYNLNSEFTQKLTGWVREEEGIRRSNRTKEEMNTLLSDVANSLWPMNIQNDILRGYIRTGFTREQVLLSWGKPDHVNTTRTLVGIHEQWVFGEAPFPRSYVYFENGVVKTWEFLKNNGR